MTVMMPRMSFYELWWKNVPPETALLLILMGVFLLRYLAGLNNHASIKQYISDHGGSTMAIRWSPLGPGCFSRDGAIYRVRYQDQDGNIREAYCKTGLFSGVYFTEDHIAVANSEREKNDAG